MQIDRVIKETIKNHKDGIELIQWAIISAVASLVYSEYIKNIRQKRTPVRMFQVPSIKSVNELLKRENQFMKLLSENLIEDLVKHDLLSEYIDAPELALFNRNDVEKLKIILDLYIIPNIRTQISRTIESKFSLNDPNQQVVRESREIDLFNRMPITDAQFGYIVDETVLQLLLLLPSMKKDVELPEQNINIRINNGMILTVGSGTAICPIHFDNRVLDNNEVMSLLSFVTNITANKINGAGEASYIITSGVFNELSLTKLNGIS